MMSTANIFVFWQEDEKNFSGSADAMSLIHKFLSGEITAPVATTAFANYVGHLHQL